jgi:hypothetical protein
MPGAHYTNQSSYSTPGGPELHPLGVSESHDTQVSSPPHIPFSGPALDARPSTLDSLLVYWILLLGVSLVLGYWDLGFSSAPSRICVEKALLKNADKTQTKCIQKRECDFSTTMPSTTCNFNALKCLNYPASLASDSESNDTQTCWKRSMASLSLGERARVRDRPVLCALPLRVFASLR